MDLSDNEYFIASFIIALASGGAHYIINGNFKPTPLLVQLGLHKLVLMWCGKNSSPALIGGAILSILNLFGVCEVFKNPSGVSQRHYAATQAHRSEDK